jgi:hypothetical protein
VHCQSLFFFFTPERMHGDVSVLVICGECVRAVNVVGYIALERPWPYFR